jgi:hypothetical protein
MEWGLTAEQRYWQAVKIAQIEARRNLRQFLAGEIDVLPCSGDRERELIIAAIERAMRE